MPPKKAAAAQAEKKKAVEDKTFGLKNKSKSAKVQKYVQQVQKSAQGPVNARAEPTRKDKKRAEEERAKGAGRAVCSHHQAAQGPARRGSQDNGV